jgi:L-asparaginase
MLKDSREITEEDRKLILKKCQECDEKQIIITHGTFTMPETAEYLGKKKVNGKTIVLTGSMVPFAEKNSDAMFNFGCAFTAVQTLKPGVYVTMNGKIFDFDNVKKNLETGEFETEK